VEEVKEVVEEVEELISQIESETEPETRVEATESVGESEQNENPEGLETPVITWDLLIAAIVAISISIVVRRRR